LSLVERVCRVLVPIQKRVLAGLQGGGLLAKWARYVVNRSPNAIYPLNLELAGKLPPELALRWSVMETFDGYAPKYDWPCTASTWRKELNGLPGGQIEACGNSGQGNTGVVRKVGATRNSAPRSFGVSYPSVPPTRERNSAAVTAGKA
jgi:hypothetical protein